MATLFQFRRATTAEWLADDEVLSDGEPGIEYKLDGSRSIRIGDGVTPFTELYEFIGPQGIAGTPGEKWFSGAGAPAGALAGSIIGDWYLRTSNGDVYEKTGAAAWTVRANILGPQGIQGIQGNPGANGANGARGSLWFSGAGAPAGGLAGTVIGDWYVNTANQDVYEKTGAAAWTLRTNIKGATGTLPAMTHALATRATDQSILDNTATLIVWDDPLSVTGPSPGAFSFNGTRNGINVNSAGLYQLDVQIAWQGNAAGYRQLMIRRLLPTDSPVATVKMEPETATSGYMMASCLLRAAADHQYKVEVLQTAGVALNIVSTNALNPRFTLTRLSD